MQKYSKSMYLDVVYFFRTLKKSMTVESSILSTVPKCGRSLSFLDCSLHEYPFALYDLSENGLPTPELDSCWVIRMK